MRTLILGLGLIISTTAFAADSAPKGTGNFRRAEVLKAAKLKDARVIGLYSGRGQAPKQTSSRLLFVEHSGGKVDIVKAPIDKAKSVSKLSEKQANRIGIISQAQAQKLAEKNSGLLGSKGKIKIKATGIGSRKESYTFSQISPASLTIKEYGHLYKASNITRTVSFSGKGESASGSQNRIDQ